MPTERLGRFLARSGIASRRAADRLLAEGRVTVNGQTAPPHGMLVDPSRDRVTVDGAAVAAERPPRRYLALNKPAGVVSTVRDPGGRPTVLDFATEAGGLFPVGRLDIDSRGLILLTDDGDLAMRLTHPRYGVPKTYRLTVPGPVASRQVEQLRAGPVLDDGPTHPISIKVSRQSSRRTILEVVIAEGRHREVRRMCSVVGIPLTDLVRIEVAGVRLGTQPEGSLRELSRAEVRRLRELVHL
ncbi:MAG: pseudouridine synthase [Candidatus Dormibacteria bacterium]